MKSEHVKLKIADKWEGRDQIGWGGGARRDEGGRGRD